VLTGKRVNRENFQNVLSRELGVTAATPGRAGPRRSTRSSWGAASSGSIPLITSATRSSASRRFRRAGWWSSCQRVASCTLGEVVDPDHLDRRSISSAQRAQIVGRRVTTRVSSRRRSLRGAVLLRAPTPRVLLERSSEAALRLLEW